MGRYGAFVAQVEKADDKKAATTVNHARGESSSACAPTARTVNDPPRYRRVQLASRIAARIRLGLTAP